ncbi:hypothetical protein D3C72_2058490 [compost metagenome]
MTIKHTDRCVPVCPCNMQIENRDSMLRWLIVEVFGHCLMKQKKKTAINKSSIIALTQEETALIQRMAIGCVRVSGLRSLFIPVILMKVELAHVLFLRRSQPSVMQMYC